MPYYRLYHFDEHSGHIERAEEIDATDDDEAVAFARGMQRQTPAELWQQSRKVHRLDVTPA